MNRRFVFLILAIVSAPTVPAVEGDESIALEIGRTARQVRDLAEEAGQATGNAVEDASDWFVGRISSAGVSLFRVAKDVGEQFDLFFYDVRQGYEKSQ